MSASAIQGGHKKTIHRCAIDSQLYVLPVGMNANKSSSLPKQTKTNSLSAWQPPLLSDCNTT